MSRNFILKFRLIFCGEILYFATAARNFKFNVAAKSSGAGRWGEVFAPNFNTMLIEEGRQIADARNWLLIDVNRENNEDF